MSLEAQLPYQSTPNRAKETIMATCRSKSFVSSRLPSRGRPPQRFALRSNASLIVIATGETRHIPFSADGPTFVAARSAGLLSYKPNLPAGLSLLSLARRT